MEKFIETAKKFVRDYSTGKSGEEIEVYVVWSCWILGNKKALLGTHLGDDLYFEVTENAQTGDIYFDVYKKEFHIVGTNNVPDDAVILDE